MLKKIGSKTEKVLMSILYPVAYERIIKWTQHIGFLTLAEIARVVEGNHGNDSN